MGKGSGGCDRPALFIAEAGIQHDDEIDEAILKIITVESSWRTFFPRDFRPIAKKYFGGDLDATEAYMDGLVNEGHINKEMTVIYNNEKTKTTNKKYLPNGQRSKAFYHTFLRVRRQAERLQQKQAEDAQLKLDQAAFKTFDYLERSVFVCLGGIKTDYTTAASLGTGPNRAVIGSSIGDPPSKLLGEALQQLIKHGLIEGNNTQKVPGIWGYTQTKKVPKFYAVTAKGRILYRYFERRAKAKKTDIDTFALNY